MKSRYTKKRRLGLAVAAAFSTMLAVPAQAIDFNLWGMDGSFTSDISLGASWRMQDQDPHLFAPGNKSGGQSSTSNTDDGNLNYDENDMYSLILKGVHDLELKRGNIGGFLRFKYWYDYEQEEGDRNHGNVNNYERNESLDDSGFSDFAKGSGFEVLDAFLYGDFEVFDKPLNIRVGEQVVSWGESTFIQNGINVINPVDVTAFRRPGVEIKEGLLPVGMVYTQLGLTDALSVEAFYQYEWAKTEIDGCGTYFSDADFAADGCNILTFSAGLSDAASLENGVFITRTDDEEASDSGQWGVALRYFAENLNFTEFGFYYINYHSRTPVFGGTVSANEALGGPEGVQFIPGDPYGGNPQFTAEFPEDIKLIGASFATNVASFAVSGEISYKEDWPAQINSTELLQASLAAAPWSQMTPIVLTLEPGQFFSGYEEVDLTQAQATVVKFFDQIMGASRVTLIGEVGWAHVGGRPGRAERRLGRSSTYGMGDFGTIDNFAGTGLPLTCVGGEGTANELLGLTPNSEPSHCTSDGYVTDNSWGYQVRARWAYNDVFAGVNLFPQIAWSHDVDGTYPGAGFDAGKQALGLSLTAEYNRRYRADIAYVSFFGGDYDTRNDRDFLSLSVGVSF
ncbi:MAG: DUF1302 domain-containing protein [Chromatiales bacterium]|jgi:hypothetical protein